MSFKIISGYTINTKYEEEIKDLESDLKRYNLDYKFYPYESKGSWVKNTLEKSKIIQQALIEFSCDIIWVDADAIIKKEPTFFTKLQDKDFDLCCHYLKTSYNPHELLTGTFYFKNNDKVKKLIDEWVQASKTNIDWDQRVLQKIVDKRKDLVIIDLPIEYIKINPRNKSIKNLECVIGHKQLSREMRKKGRVI